MREQGYFVSRPASAFKIAPAVDSAARAIISPKAMYLRSFISYNVIRCDIDLWGVVIMSRVNLYHNGFLVKRINNDDTVVHGQYKGIEGGNWPIGRAFSSEAVSAEEQGYLVHFLENNVFLNGSDSSYVDVCPNIYFMKRYVKACRTAGFEVQVLYCRTQRRYPECDIDPVSDNYRLIGYDYGSAGGDYHSCVLSEAGRLEGLPHFQLNKYGLFGSEPEILEFIKLRNELKKANPELGLEDWDFIIYQLWECENI
jgi:hypothetical protein